MPCSVRLKYTAITLLCSSNDAVKTNSFSRTGALWTAFTQDSALSSYSTTRNSCLILCTHQAIEKSSTEGRTSLVGATPSTGQESTLWLFFVSTANWHSHRSLMDSLAPLLRIARHPDIFWPTFRCVQSVPFLSAGLYRALLVKWIKHPLQQFCTRINTLAIRRRHQHDDLIQLFAPRTIPHEVENMSWITLSSRAQCCNQNVLLSIRDDALVTKIYCFPQAVIVW